MAFELITGGPVSAIFILVLLVSTELVLWKLRKNGKTYRMLSNLALAVGVLVVVLFLGLFLT